MVAKAKDTRNPIRKVTEREYLQSFIPALPDLGVDAEHNLKGRQAITRLDRNGEALWIFGDADRHERRVQREQFSRPDQLFWATIVIACGSPGVVRGKPSGRFGTLAKQFGTLNKARNDLDSFFQYYRPMLVGSPFFTGAEPGFGKSPGFFDCASNLNNPTVKDLRAAVLAVREWIEVNQQDPEYTSFQLNFCFSGHGNLDGNRRPGIVLADACLDAGDLASLLLSSIPKQEITPGPCRLDLFLDCCHSSAVAHGLDRAMASLQRAVDPDRRSVLRTGQVYCSCLDDESSFEMKNLQHSVFTFTFLNECSRKQPEGARITNLGLRDVGWYTEGWQHPLLLDFTARGGSALKFPSEYYLTHRPDLVPGGISGRPAIDPERYFSDPISEAIRFAREMRARCVSVERQLSAQETLRIPFSRDEILTNKRFPFL